MNISNAYKYQLTEGKGKSKRYTTDHKLAIQLGKETGKKPIEFISPRIRDAYKKAYPELNKVPKNGKN